MMRVLLAFTAVVGCVPGNRAASPSEVVEHAWGLVDERYALFVDKSVDWDGARDDALAAVTDDMPDPELFDVVTDMLNTLDDGHVNLVSSFDVSWVPAYLEEGVPTYDEDLVERGVLGFEFRQVGAYTYAVPDPSWAYLRVDDFSSLPGSGTQDLVFETLSAADQLVVDLRGNGGGQLEQASVLVARLIDEPVVGWHLQSSTGPARDALSDPEPQSIQPAAVRFDGPVHLLVDGRTYSAANTFTFALGGRDGVRVVGEPTAGGAGSPRWFELPNRWAMRFPTRRLTGPEQESVEGGYAPDVIVGPDPALSREGRDAMIEAALNP